MVLAHPKDREAAEYAEQGAERAEHPAPKPRDVAIHHYQADEDHAERHRAVVEGLVLSEHGGPDRVTRVGYGLQPGHVGKNQQVEQLGGGKISRWDDRQADGAHHQTDGVEQTDLSVPVRLGGYYYYSRTVEGLQYPIRCRKASAAEES